jgi:hypothetical protein
VQRRLHPPSLSQPLVSLPILFYPLGHVVPRKRLPRGGGRGTRQFRSPRRLWSRVEKSEHVIDLLRIDVPFASPIF